MGEKYLYPIVFSSGTTGGRKGLQKTAWEVDDGNMRAIALTMNKQDEITVYLGLRLWDLMLYKVRNWLQVVTR